MHFKKGMHESDSLISYTTISYVTELVKVNNIYLIKQNSFFLSPVVFMGSKKYPDENEFDTFLKKHGGTDNATTDTERTVFQFDIQKKHFKEALDR